MRKLIPYFILIFVIFPLIWSGGPLPAQAETNILGDPCRIALTVVRGLVGYDLSQIGVSSYLDWDVYRNNSVADHIEHVKVVRLRDYQDLYAYTLANLPYWVPLYPGAVWVIGNEPDTFHGLQDNLTPEAYAERFYTVATMIRGIDPTARLGFAPLVQPSPLRIKYLNRVFDRLDDPDLFASPANALNYIDILTMHSFILNEEPGLLAWGAGIPPGFPDDDPDAFVIDIQTEITKTHDINIFSGWVTNLRQWMYDHGAQSKPLWITEYGSLLPPLDPPDANYYNVSDEDTRDYMLQTFDFLYNGIDSTIGLPADGYRMVQRGYWYSLNDYRTSFGGALIDPVTRIRTVVGDAFVTYDPPVAQVPQDPYPVSATAIPLRYTPGSGKTHVDYRVVVRVGNTVNVERLAPVVLNVTQDGIPMAPQADTLARCGGVHVFSYDLLDIDPSALHHIQATVSPDGGLTDTNLGNNTLDADLTLTMPLELFIPMISR